jgi:hypothetical protein
LRRAEKLLVSRLPHLARETFGLYEQFYPETVRILGVAFAQVAIVIATTTVKQAIANKIIWSRHDGPS